MVMGLGVLLGIGDGAFNGVFHVKHGELLTVVIGVRCSPLPVVVEGCDVSRETLTFLWTMKLIRR